jgi:hypothetical protein
MKMVIAHSYALQFCLKLLTDTTIRLVLDLPSEKDIRKMQQELFGAFDDPNDGLDQAFAKIQDLREKGAGLPDNERRKLAAQVALSFSAHFNDIDDST